MCLPTRLAMIGKRGERGEQARRRRAERERKREIEGGREGERARVP